MALIPQDPKQQKALVAILVVAAGVWAFNEYWYKPRAAEIEAVETRVTGLETRNRQAQITAARGGSDIEERNALYERHVADLEQLIPQNEEVPPLIRTINEEARRARVTIQEMIPEPPRPGEFYTSQGWRMRVIGEYDDVGRFVTFIASLPRIMRPVDMDLSIPLGQAVTGLNYADPVLAAFRIELYTIPSASQVAPQTGTGG
jgi:Tfp pilus assembly protein PilO